MESVEELEREQKIRFLAADILLKGQPQKLEEVCKDCLLFSVSPDELRSFTLLPIQFRNPPRREPALFIPFDGYVFVCQSFCQEIGKRAILDTFSLYQTQGGKWAGNLANSAPSVPTLGLPKLSSRELIDGSGFCQDRKVDNEAATFLAPLLLESTPCHAASRERKTSLSVDSSNWTRNGDLNSCLVRNADGETRLGSSTPFRTEFPACPSNIESVVSDGATADGIAPQVKCEPTQRSERLTQGSGTCRKSEVAKGSGTPSRMTRSAAGYPPKNRWERLEGKDFQVSERKKPGRKKGVPKGIVQLKSCRMDSFAPEHESFQAGILKSMEGGKDPESVIEMGVSRSRIEIPVDAETGCPAPAHPLNVAVETPEEERKESKAKELEAPKKRRGRRKKITLPTTKNKRGKRKIEAVKSATMDGRRASTILRRSSRQSGVATRNRASASGIKDFGASGLAYPTVYEIQQGMATKEQPSELRPTPCSSVHSRNLSCNEAIPLAAKPMASKQERSLYVSDTEEEASVEESHRIDRQPCSHVGTTTEAQRPEQRLFDCDQDLSRLGTAERQHCASLHCNGVSESTHRDGWTGGASIPVSQEEPPSKGTEPCAGAYFNSSVKSAHHADGEIAVARRQFSEVQVEDYHSLSGNGEYTSVGLHQDVELKTQSDADLIKEGAQSDGLRDVNGFLASEEKRLVSRVELLLNIRVAREHRKTLTEGLDVENQGLSNSGTHAGLRFDTAMDNVDVQGIRESKVPCPLGGGGYDGQPRQPANPRSGATGREQNVESKAISWESQPDSHLSAVKALTLHDRDSEAFNRSVKELGLDDETTDAQMERFADNHRDVMMVEGARAGCGWENGDNQGAPDHYLASTVRDLEHENFESMTIEVEANSRIQKLDHSTEFTGIRGEDSPIEHLTAFEAYVDKICAPVGTHLQSVCGTEIILDIKQGSSAVQQKPSTETYAGKSKDEEQFRLRNFNINPELVQKSFLSEMEYIGISLDPREGQATNIVKASAFSHWDALGRGEGSGSPIEDQNPGTKEASVGKVKHPKGSSIVGGASAPCIIDEAKCQEEDQGKGLEIHRKAGIGQAKPSQVDVEDGAPTVEAAARAEEMKNRADTSSQEVILASLREGLCNSGRGSLVEKDVPGRKVESPLQVVMDCTSERKSSRVHAVNKPGTSLGRYPEVPRRDEVSALKKVAPESVVRVVDPIMNQKNQEFKIVPEFEDFTVIGEEGSGGYGTVYRVMNNATKRIYAMKCPLLKTHPSCVDNEINMLRELGGKGSVIKFEDVVPGKFRSLSDSGEKVTECKSILLEFMEHDKPEVLKKEINLEELRHYAVCLFKALAHMHQKRIMHLDVKPGNFLFSRSRKRGYLVDFNLARDEQKAPKRVKKVLPNSHFIGRIDTSRRSSKRPLVHEVAGTPATYSKRSRLLMGASGTQLSFGTPSPAKSLSVLRDQSNSKVARVSAEMKVSSPRLPDLAQSMSTTPMGAHSSPRRAEESPKFITQQFDGGVGRHVEAAVNIQENHAQGPRPQTGRRGILKYIQTKVYNQQPPVLTQNQLSLLASQRKRVAAVQSKKKPLVAGGAPEIHRVAQPSIVNRPKAVVKLKGLNDQIKDGPCVGTKGYRAPEVLLRSLKQTTKVDMWSAGVSLLQLVTGRSPFPATSTDGALKDIAKLRGSDQVLALATRHERQHCLSKELCSLRTQPVTLKEWCDKHTRRPDFKHRVPPELFDLLEKCLSVDPDSRITAADALGHQFCSSLADESET